MGRQIRKIAPWMGMFEAHLHSNHVIHRLYRWTNYHSHPTMRPGHPFKTRAYGRPFPGMLLTPDVFIFKIPIALSFVGVDNKYNPRVQKNENKTQVTKGLPYVKAKNFEEESNCQKTANNYNNCLKNNSQTGADTCFYYLNYLNNNCGITQ